MKTALDLILSAARELRLKVDYADTLKTTSTAFSVGDNIDDTGMLLLEYLNSTLRYVVGTNEWKRLQTTNAFETQSEAHAVFNIETVFPGFVKFCTSKIMITADLTILKPEEFRDQTVFLLPQLSPDAFQRWRVYAAKLYDEYTLGEFFSAAGQNWQAGWVINQSTAGQVQLDFGCKMPAGLIIEAGYQNRYCISDGTALKEDFSKSLDTCTSFDDELLILGIVIRYKSGLGWDVNQEAEMFNAFIQKLLKADNLTGTYKI